MHLNNAITATVFNVRQTTHRYVFWYAWRMYVHHLCYREETRAFGRSNWIIEKRLNGKRGIHLLMVCAILLYCPWWWWP